jgi:hypothetical protein
MEEGSAGIKIESVKYVKYVKFVVGVVHYWYRRALSLVTNTHAHR